ncbi:hypothetical protein Purlil1_8866 [Purpureocillium lilacinum]|uniref:NAD(P)-binding protein n=1 Tax=Purpureocillium lilacinum TaxID=33203 RepID=A0ABR0BS07_PURLI|nr:hypothetical protein Purlil1_8866 [Purpureocillium lilacinum]
MSGLTTKTIVITGASRGLDDIKLEFVRQLSDNSHHRVIAVVRNPEILLQSSILARKNVYVVKGDLSDLESFSDVAAKISEVGNGKVDILINNAGVMVGAGAQSQVALSRSTPDEWAEQFKINVLSLVFFTIALLPLLEHGEDKKVINLGSFLGDLDFALAKDDLHYSSYSVTKAAVNMANIKFHNE